ncbi:hypothetical protein L1987_46425 [Smallanthus sonchifolius]|uniref:Uncharacterized protein n=1 Tax=Smallanthus sonchifolius TaxID=185202 RepID=A0ACB9FZE4_9ASTR|nr:hypothetical protein L1987_46425 [Smallanthus sonchifolius]
MAPSLDCLSSSLLLCAEENDTIFYEDDDDDRNGQNINQNQRFLNHFETEDSVLDLDFPLQADVRLTLLIEKECEQFLGFFDYFNNLKNGKLDMAARQEAVDWITKVHAYFNFGPLTAYLSVNYLDRFLAVYELPVGGSRFVFEAKSIQKMELLVLTTLKWRIQAVTLIFFDDFVLTTLKWRIQDERFVPSEIAAAVAIHVVGSTQISATLVQHVPKERVLKCMELLKELNGDCTMSFRGGTLASMPKSPTGVLEACMLQQQNW